MSHTPYVQFEEGRYEGHHINRVGCMKCNDTIATKAVNGDLVYWTHKRDLPLLLSDGTMAYAPVCSHCFSHELTAEDILHFDNTIKHGWMLEQAWAYKRWPKRGTLTIIRAGQMSRKIFVVGRGN